MAWVRVGVTISTTRAIITTGCTTIAVNLIRQGLAYVDSLNSRTSEGVSWANALTTPGKNAPDRVRPIEENLRLFGEMRQGKHPEGSYVLRAKLDRKVRTSICVSPLFNGSSSQATAYTVTSGSSIRCMIDFTHPISDARSIGITHSICTLEFETTGPCL
jgi:glutaminyl-tRNA synthetase